MEQVTKVDLIIISKPHAYPHTIKKNMQSFKRSGTKLYEGLRSQETPTVYILMEEND